ncbi:hypothetical protein HYT57_05800 [Candidatus Woesearchaeota archaeon]|nr:hypothetical protein [Candidatus Woesearchaeota archaeon]
MKELFAPIKRVLSRISYFLIFVVSGLFYGVIFLMMTNLIDVRSGLSNIRFAFTWQSALFFIIFSILGGLLISLQVFSFREKQKNYTSTTTGVSGMLVSFFATTCPFCKPLLISLLGLSGSIAILKFGLVLAFVSIILLMGSIYLTLKSISKRSCCQ